MLKQYSRKKENLLAIYNMLIENKSEFVDSDLKSELLEKEDSLQSDKFILAVAGQMKAGKSTLLNAMIFGNDILPADDTELTAKITFITYDEEPSYEATLYTLDEFTELRNSLRGTTDESDFNKLLNTSLEILQDKGYSSVEELLIKKKIKGNNFKQLIDFVGKNGIFTPFVNTLTLKTNSKWVKNIMVVDTPGMNSPNKLRDNVVKDWIIKADAVVYCSYAGRAMDATDLNFINDYMLHISPKHRLVALTKSDLINGEDRLMNAIGDMVDSSWNREKKLIPSKYSIFPVCQMAVLLDKMDKAKLPFSERMEEEFKDYDKKNIFDQANSQFLKLEQAIESKLIANKDANIIESNENYLNSIFESKLLSIKESIDISEKGFELLIADQKELAAKEKDIKNDIKVISEKLDLINDRIRNLYIKELDSFQIVNGFINVKAKIQKKLNGMSLTKLNSEASIIVNNCMTDYLIELKEQSDKFSKDFSKGIQKIFDQLDLQLEYINTDLLKEKIEIKCTSLIKLKITNFKYGLYNAAIGLKQLYSDKVGWFKNIFKGDTTKGKIALEEFIKQSIEPIIKALEKLESILKADLSEDVTAIIATIEEDNRNLLTVKQSEIENLRSKSTGELESLKKIEKEKLFELKESKLKLDNLKEDILNKINSEELWEA